MSWSDRQFEKYVKLRLEDEFPNDHDKHWARYVMTRSAIKSEILPHIAASEPSLSDHGADHIVNVIENCGQVLGIEAKDLRNELWTERKQERSATYNLSSAELLLLLMGCLLHDIGNINGRKGHNQVTRKVWKAAAPSSFSSWKNQDIKTIIKVCQAHTGKGKDGSANTLQDFAIEDTFFLGKSVRAGVVAAVLRFADELAEGAQRTSLYLLKKRFYETESEIYHQYAKVTEVAIDPNGGRIALHYTIEITDLYFSQSDQSWAEQLESFLKFCFMRIEKLDYERLYTRHYAPEHLPFNETSIVLSLHSDGEELCPDLTTVLNDFHGRPRDGTMVAGLSEHFSIESIVAQFDSSEDDHD